MKHAWLLVGLALALGACTDVERSTQPAPTATPPTTTQAATDAAIFHAAISFDPAMRDVWKTVVVPRDQRTDTRATVQLWSEQGEAWEYTVKKRDALWEVESAIRNDAQSSPDRRISFSPGTLFDHSLSSTTKLARAFDVFAIDPKEKFYLFIPQAGLVYDQQDWDGLSVDKAEWFGAKLTRVDFNGERWEAEFQWWQACMRRPDFSWDCHAESSLPTYSIPGWVMPNGDVRHANRVWLTYKNTLISGVDTTVASVTISPNQMYIPYGQNVTVTATARNTSGAPLANQIAAWTVYGNTAQATSTGPMTAQVTGVLPGTATLQALVKGVQGTATVHIDPTVSTSGPTYGESESIVLSAVPNPSGGSYFYEWEYTYCENERVPVHPCGYAGWHNGTSGQDATTYAFFMSKYYYYASFRVTLRESNAGRVIARSEWTVNGAEEEKPDYCARGICPESVDPDTVVTKQS